MHNKPKKEMTNKERRDAGLAYISDGSIFEEQLVCRKILQRLNFMDRSNFAGISEVVKELFGKSEGAFVNPPFYCDYGKHIEVGKNFFANYNCTLYFRQSTHYHQLSLPCHTHRQNYD